MNCSPWIQTSQGLVFGLAAPTLHMVSARDIAHALANQCRFAGHCRKFYSVAEHCVLVSRALERSHGREAAFVGLMHDAAEAYVQDITRLLKRALPGHADFERRAWLAVCDRFKLPTLLPEAVRLADLRMLATELEYLMLPPPAPWGLGVSPFELGEIGLKHPADLGLYPHKAHVLFLERFAELSV